MVVLLVVAKQFTGKDDICDEIVSYCCSSDNISSGRPTSKNDQVHVADQF